MATLDYPQRIEVVRRFTRFYTRRLGPSRHHATLGTLSRTAGRVLAELAVRKRTTPTALGSDLGLDPGQLSRLLRALRSRHLVARERSPTDRRQSVLSLTPLGRKAAAKLDGDAR